MIPDPLTLVSRLLILMFAFPIHEFAHAWVADRFGDPQPRLDGRLSLNPAVHLDLMGSLILLVAGFGWARPVSVSPYILRRRSPAALMWVSLAGPISNLILAVLAAIPIRFGWLPVIPIKIDGQPVDLVLAIVGNFVIINLVLLFFNLIPIAPLDGEKILDYFLPPNMSIKLEAISQYGPMILMALLFIGPMIGIDILGQTLWPLVSLLYGVLTGRG